MPLSEGRSRGRRDCRARSPRSSGQATVASPLPPAALPHWEQKALCQATGETKIASIASRAFRAWSPDGPRVPPTSSCSWSPFLCVSFSLDHAPASSFRKNLSFNAAFPHGYRGLSPLPGGMQPAAKLGLTGHVFHSFQVICSLCFQVKYLQI